GALAILSENRFETWELEGRRRNEALHDCDAIYQRTKLCFEWGDQQADHGATKHFRRVADFAGGADYANRVRRVRRDKDNFRIGSLDGTHDRGEFGGRRWIALVVNNIKAMLNRVRARSSRRGLREFGIG